MFDFDEIDEKEALESGNCKQDSERQAAYELSASPCATNVPERCLNEEVTFTDRILKITADPTHLAAIEAEASKLIPGWTHLKVKAHMVGTTGMCYKLTCDQRSAEAYSVRITAFVEPRERRDFILSAAQILSDQCLTPKVAAYDEDKSFIQHWAPGGCPPQDSLHREAVEAARFGRLLANIHSSPVPEMVDQKLSTQGSSYFEEMLLWADAIEAAGIFRLLARNEVPSPTREDISAKLTFLKEHIEPLKQGPFATEGLFCHGDFHLWNIVVEPSILDSFSKPTLQVVDLEHVDLKPPVQDIALLFLSTTAPPVGSYPPLANRRAFVKAYLETRSLLCDEASIEEVLWQIEVATPFQLLRTYLGTLHQLIRNEDREKSEVLQTIKDMKFWLWDLATELVPAALLAGKDNPAARIAAVKLGAGSAELKKRYPMS